MSDKKQFVFFVRIQGFDQCDVVSYQSKAVYSCPTKAHGYGKHLENFITEIESVVIEVWEIDSVGPSGLTKRHHLSDFNTKEYT